MSLYLTGYYKWGKCYCKIVQLSLLYIGTALVILNRIKFITSRYKCNKSRQIFYCFTFFYFLLCGNQLVQIMWMILVLGVHVPARHFHSQCGKFVQRLQLFFSLWVFFREHLRFTGQQEKGVFLFNSSPPLPPASQTLRHQPGDYCREITSAHSQQPNSKWEPLVSTRKLLTTKLRAKGYDNEYWNDIYKLFV